MTRILIVALISIMGAACAESGRPAGPPAVPEATTPVPVREAPAAATRPAQTPPLGATKALSPASPAAKGAPPGAKALVWKMKKGKLTGTPRMQLVAQDNDAKSGQTISTYCWRYPTFAVIEIKGSKEVGAGELDLRRESQAHENLCAVEFAGKVDNLNIIEGDFVGVAGDYVVIEGADTTDGPPQFQLLSTVTNKEVFKGVHNPNEEFELTKRGHRTSLRFYSRLKVKCEMATEVSECWTKVLNDNPMKKPTAMPDCKTAFAKAGVKVNEDAVVTVPAEIEDLSAPRVELIGGRATCAPVPDAEKQ